MEGRHVRVYLKKKRFNVSHFKQYQATYDNVLQHFNCNCKIQAFGPYGTPRKFAEFEMNLAKDAIDCQADAIEIHDYDTEAITFQIQPFTLAMMINGLK